MEINPYEARLRMLQLRDGVQMQREAAPDEETAGCPGCPYFWTCPVPHRGEEVRAPRDIELEDVTEALGPRRAFTPRDESDIGWSDVWVDEDGLRIDPDELDDPAPEVPGPESPEATAAPELGDDPQHSDDPEDTEDPDEQPAAGGRTPRFWRRLRRRR